MLCKHQLIISDYYNIPIGNVKKLMPNFFDKEKYPSFSKLATLLETRVKTKKIHGVLEFNQSQWLELYIEIPTRKRIETETRGQR